MIVIVDKLVVEKVSDVELCVIVKRLIVVSFNLGFYSMVVNVKFV